MDRVDSSLREQTSLRSWIGGVQRNALIVGIVGIALLVVGAFINSAEFFRAYLYGYLFWIGISVGALGLKLLHNMVSGAWGFAIRRLLETAIKTLPLMFLLALPLFFLGLHELYPWTHEEVLKNSEVIRSKVIYLNPPFFWIRMVIYFAVWIGFGFYSNKLSTTQENTPPPAPPLTRKIQRYSAIGLLLLILTLTFAVFDWSMSLEPEWFSTIYGLIYLVAWTLSAMCFVVILVVKLSDQREYSGALMPSVYHDFGNLMFAMTMLWAYMSLSQLLIIWMANIAEETPWYIKRMSAGWGVMGWGIVLLHFAVPFLLLLQRRTKRTPIRLRSVAFLLLAMRLVDLYWITQPAFYGGEFHFNWLCLVAPLGIGGLWIAYFMWQLKDKTLMPLYDPRMQVALERARHAGEAEIHAGHGGAHVPEGGV